MKFFLKIQLLCFFIAGNLHAQTFQEIASKGIDDAVPLFSRISGFKNVDDIKLLGLGDVAEFAKESKKVNAAFSAYLIKNKKFRNILLPADDWLLRPLNSYLTSGLPADSTRADSLIKNIFPTSYRFRNREFRSFILWIKKYNLMHRDEQVNLYGVAPLSRIPASYFLLAYVYPLDEPEGRKLSEKWSNSSTSDSTAFSDIRMWVNMQKSKKLPKAHADLILRCEEDLLHNLSVVTVDSITQRFPAKVLNGRSQYIAKQVAKKLDKKAIFYTSNTDVVTTDVRSTLGQEDVPLRSIGGLLKKELKNNYYVFVTDFADSASLPMVDIAARSMKIEVLVGSEQARALKAKSEYLNGEKDADLMKGYQPPYFYPFKEIRTSVVSHPGEYTADALFLLSHLSEIDFSY